MNQFNEINLKSSAPSLKKKNAKELRSNSYSPSSRSQTKYHKLNLDQKIVFNNDLSFKLESKS